MTTVKRPPVLDTVFDDEILRAVHAAGERVTCGQIMKKLVPGWEPSKVDLRAYCSKLGWRLRYLYIVGSVERHYPDNGQGGFRYTVSDSWVANELWP